MNFKVGDIVIPKKNLNASTIYGELTLYEGMKKELYSRSHWVITNIRTDRTGVVGIDLEGTAFTYTPEMLEPLLSLGHLVQFNDDSLAFVAKSTGELCLSGPKHWFPLDCLDKNLKYRDSTFLYIKRVYGLSASNMHAWKLETTGRECIWERKTKKKEMTIAEIEKKLGYSIKVIKEEEF